VRRIHLIKGKSDRSEQDDLAAGGPHVGLKQLPATAICGNDITSSCLYVSALAIVYAGRWAPVALLLVAAVLYLFRSVYAEVVGALPLNGGAYNALLNTTSKFRASLAACLTVLSYMATAVISANEAVRYVHDQWSIVPVTATTIALLVFFGLITIIGITESSRVATGIFLLHLGTLAILLMAGMVQFARSGFDILHANLGTPTPGGMTKALFFGFSAAMLGISGFESSANFVEEQAQGVFPKTLRNMWIAVTVLNPGMALLALMMVPLDTVAQHEEALLAHMGGIAGGGWLHFLISVDAALVLSGAVLTSFVGVNGLVQRMALDRCLPQFLLYQNRRGTTHRIIVGFFLLTVSILLITGGELRALAGVYTLSFLAVMALFGLGNILLKIKRARLPRPARSSWPGTVIAIGAVVAGVIGNAVMNPPYLRVFIEYLVPTVLVVSVVLWRINLLRAGLFIVRQFSSWLAELTGGVSKAIRERIDRINDQQVVFFTRGDNAANLNSALLYVRRNENPKRVKIVIVANSPQEIPPRLEKDLRFLDDVYPDVEIEFVVVEGSFGPDLIRQLSKKWTIPTNLMFIGSPGERFPHRLADLGGVRLII
jgi:amino acid transporter